MARIFDIGWEQQAATDGVEAGSLSWNGTGTIDTTVKRSGAAACRFSALGASTKNWDTSLGNQSLTDAYLRVAIYLHVAPTSTSTLFKIRDQAPTDRLGIKVTNGKVLQLFDLAAAVQIGSNSAGLALDTWYVVEVRWSVGTYTARINGQVFATGTPTTPGTTIGLLSFGAFATDATLDYVCDDISLNDTAGAGQTSWPGIGKLICLIPTAAGDINTFATQTGGTAGAANNFTRVDEVTPNDVTDFNGSSTLNQEDMFNVDDSGIDSLDTVNCVTLGSRCRNSTADTTAALKLQIKKVGSGTITQGIAQIPNSITWKSNKFAAADVLTALVLYLDPDGAPWTRSTLDSMQIGYKLTTAPAVGGRRIDVSKVWAYVDYTPAIIPNSLNIGQAVNRASTY